MNSLEKWTSEGADSYAEYPVLEENLIGVIFGGKESSEDTESGDLNLMVDGKGDWIMRDGGCMYGTWERYIPNPKSSSSHPPGTATAVKTPMRALLDVTGSTAKVQDPDAS
jgi:hypothetical protein